MKVYERVRIIIVMVPGLLALGLLTWGMGKAYLDLVEQPKHLSQEVVNSSDSTLLILPEVKFWTCQVGVFQSAGNAQLRKEQLNVLNIKAEVISSNPWPVSLGLGHSAEELKGLKQALAEKGISTIPKQIVLPKQTFRVAGNGSQLTADLLTNTNALLRDGLSAQVLAKEKEIWNTGATVYPHKNLEELHRIFDQLRGISQLEEQNLVSLALYSEYQRVINKLSGK